MRIASDIHTLQLSALLQKTPLERVWEQRHHLCRCGSSPAELLLDEKVTLTNVTLLFVTQRAASPKKLSPENIESSIARSVSLITIVAPGSSTALIYCTPAGAQGFRLCYNVSWDSSLLFLEDQESRLTSAATSSSMHIILAVL